MIAFNWDTFNNANCESYNVYRAITGIVVNPASLTPGDVLTFSATSVTIQNITFSAVDVSSIVSIFNASSVGALATASNDGTKVFLRATARRSPRFRVYACTFATHASQAPRIIVPNLEWMPINNTVRTMDIFSYSYIDLDGYLLDSYRVSSITSSVESFPSNLTAPIIGSASLCVVEGRLSDAQNRPLVGAKIKVRISTPMERVQFQGVDGVLLEAKTDAYGRFSIPLTRCKVYLFQIPDVGYNESVEIPDVASINFLRLRPTTEDQYSPYGDPG